MSRYNLWWESTLEIGQEHNTTGEKRTQQEFLANFVENSCRKPSINKWMTNTAKDRPTRLPFVANHPIFALWIATVVSNQIKTIPNFYRQQHTPTLRKKGNTLYWRYSLVCVKGKPHLKRTWLFLVGRKGARVTSQGLHLWQEALWMEKIPLITSCKREGAMSTRHTCLV